eukprot:CAMPEP_0118835352 /NCGR_PEP_ID=MMETSP1162-20130426/53872_1 /TAXON_ID=33656 /ORGANISM="Phaeocystis Sp, Strain CCMP2710" /LENGTH=56 /DNA_ID=CAMNT_0006767111 /DNA_START=103 /DNA_END=270 /DNA_ORIENTATION=-
MLSWEASALRCWWNVGRSHGVGGPSIRSGPSRRASWTSLRMTAASEELDSQFDART